MDRFELCKAIQAAAQKLNNYLNVTTYWFSKEEIAQLQPLFNDKITFAKALWLRTEDKQGNWRYWAHDKNGSQFGYMSCEQLEKQLEILNNKIEECAAIVNKISKATTQDELYQLSMDYINKYIQRTIEETMDARMDDTARKHKRFLDTTISIEQGKLVKENGDDYTCIVLRYKSGGYKGSIILSKNEDGLIRYEYRAPLGGHCRGTIPSENILQVLKAATYYIIM